MGEVKRYAADRVPIKWNDDGHFGDVQQVVLAADYDALLADARRLRVMLQATKAHHLNEREPGCKCNVCSLLAATADLEVTP